MNGSNLNEGCRANFLLGSTFHSTFLRWRRWTASISRPELVLKLIKKIHLRLRHLRQRRTALVNGGNLSGRCQADFLLSSTFHGTFLRWRRWTASISRPEVVLKLITKSPFPPPPSAPPPAEDSVDERQ